MNLKVKVTHKKINNITQKLKKKENKEENTYKIDMQRLIIAF